MPGVAEARVANSLADAWSFGVHADDDGNFYDLHKRVKDGIVYNNVKGADVAVLGDIHIRHSDEEVTDEVFKLLDKMKPKHTIIHDISEMESILHWDEKDPFRLLEKEQDGSDDLGLELDEVSYWIRDHLQYNLVIARSNHDDMLDRWLKNEDWKKQPTFKNSRTVH